MVDELRYIPFQLLFSLLFSFISLLLYLSINNNNSKNNDVKAIGSSIMGSLGKLLLSIGVLVPFYTMYCPINSYYLLNFIITYLLYMILDTYFMSKSK